MAYTYTRTYTKQELMFKELNKTVYSIIKYSMENNEFSDYKGIMKDGTPSDEKPFNLYEEGLLIGENFFIRKYEGLPRFDGAKLEFTYKDEEGEVYSSGENYEKSYVLLKGATKVNITELIENPATEEYVKRISKNLKELDEFRRSPKVGYKL